MTLTREQQRQVREHLGHGRGDRVVTIHRDGTVTYIGSLSGFDYDKHRIRLLGGDADELLREVHEAEMEHRRTMQDGVDARIAEGLRNAKYSIT